SPRVPLLDRKKILWHTVPLRSAVALYADSINHRGCDFFRAVYARNLKGLVAKWKRAVPPGSKPLVGEDQESRLQSGARSTPPVRAIVGEGIVESPFASLGGPGWQNES